LRFMLVEGNAGQTGGKGIFGEGGREGTVRVGAMDSGLGLMW